MGGRKTCLEGSVEIVALRAESRAEPGQSGNRGGRGPRSTHRLDKAQLAAAAALAAVSSYLDANEDLPVFFGRLSETVAGLVGARRAGFLRLGPRGALSLQPRAFGFPTNSLIHTICIERDSKGGNMVDRILRGD